MDKTSHTEAFHGQWTPRHCRVAGGREVATGPGISRDSIGEL